ncbi:DsrE family protein [Christensenellaceae bacterium NSJ-44]|uniref:DsrE family protein n=1 Tax=Luoshenia tenuis TaxID=2763654 RepID=A0A926CZ48_9FIRM|nr:DsrE family protein [Luoshenia tenuis]MBC8529390.1 DsrE family protein [Luoshenia tenuis]
MRVIFHVDEEEKWPLALGNVKNMVAYCRQNASAYEIEVVANSQAVLTYRESGHLEAEMQALSQQGVKFAACQNALRALGISQEELSGFVHPVPAGVVELAQKQAQGFAYIKP